jgi:heptaprenyl diphosphate synthase
MIAPIFGIADMPDYLRCVNQKILKVTTESICGLGRVLQAPGKMLRPSIVIAVAYYSGKVIDDSVINAAAAVELVQLASLVHDDIMDEGILRHGVATINAKEGSDMALLAGDYLLAKACVLATSVSPEAGITIAESIADLCIGQALEFKDQFNTNRTIKSLNQAIAGKTSSLFIAACKLGGLVSNLSPIQINALIGFAENFGIAFQYMDDIADFNKNHNDTKSAQTDIKAGNYTLPIILSLKGSQKLELKKLLKSPILATKTTYNILDSDGSIEQTKQKAGSYKKIAAGYLDGIEIPNLEDGLRAYLAEVI